MAQILVVDDTPNIRKMVKLALVSAGHQVEIAADGPQGIERFGDGSAFDLTLVDQQMPGLEGREFVIEARQRDPQARLVMMTAFATSELATQVMQSGALDFLRKPFTVEVLRSAVEGALSTPRHDFSPQIPDPFEMLPAPGEAGFIVPRLSFRFNGYAFWPLLNDAAEQNTEIFQGIEFGRAFQVRHPSGDLTRCFVGITPHIHEQATLENGQNFAPGDLFWEKLCGAALLNFLWEKSGPPPAVLPVYEMPKSNRNPRTAVTWGALGF